jgi:hypothetical protein
MANPEPHEGQERAEYVERGTGRLRAVRIVNTVISIVCGIFAAVLAIHILLVIGDANPDNAFARFITDWAGGITLGLDNLFTPADENLQVLLNEGLAALLWLAIGAVLTTLISRIALPSGERQVWYRRTVR